MSADSWKRKDVEKRGYWAKWRKVLAGSALKRFISFIEEKSAKIQQTSPEELSELLP
jgi:hypothetical protein